MNERKALLGYILANRSRNLYTGITNNLMRRVFEHRQGLTQGFAKKYRIHRLVYCEAFDNPRDAIRREKQIKSWRREKKLALIKPAIQPGTIWPRLGFTVKSRFLAPKVRGSE